MLRGSGLLARSGLSVLWGQDLSPAELVQGLSRQRFPDSPACRCSRQKTWVLSLGREDPLEKEMAAYSSIRVQRIPIDKGDWWATVHGVP